MWYGDIVKPSILHIYKDYFPPVVGGIEKHIHDLAQASKDTYDITVLVANTRAKTEEEDADGIRVIKAACLGRVAAAPLCPTFPALLRRHAADIMHFHCPNPTGDLSWLLSRPPGRVAVTYHSDVIRQAWAMFFYGPFLRRFLSRADVIMPTSPNYVESSPWLSRVKNLCIPVPLGIDTAHFEKTPELEVRAADLRRISGERPIILFVGRLRYYKGLRYLVQAMPRLDAQLVIIGSGPEEKIVRDMAARFHVGDKISIVGSVSDADLAAWYHAADIFCLPSHLRSEAFGLVQIEAMASGLPVVSCDLKTGVPYVNQHEKTGLIVPPACPGRLAEALERLLKDDDLRRRLGENAHRRAREEFDRSLMLKRIREIYTRLLSQN